MIFACAISVNESSPRHVLSFRHCLYSLLGGHLVPPNSYVR